MGRPKGSKNKPKESVQPDSESVPAETTEDNHSPDDDQGKPAARPHYLDRTALLNEVAQSNRERDESEEEDEDEIPAVGKPMGKSAESTGQEDQPSGDEDQGKDSGEAEEQVASQEKPREEKQTRKFKIDGVEQEFTEEQIMAFVQKGATADKRLNEATRILEGAKRATATNGAEAPATQQTNGQDGQPSTPKDVDQLADDLAKAVLYGDQEMMTESIRKLVAATGRSNASTSQAVTPAQINRHVSEAIAFNDARRLLALPPEQGGFADIYADPMMQRMFHNREDELRNGDPSKGIQPDTRGYSELYTAIGQELRTWRDGVVKLHAPKTGLETRDDKKRQSGIVQGSTSRPPATAPAPAKTERQRLEANVDGIRRSRGLY